MANEYRDMVQSLNSVFESSQASLVQFRAADASPAAIAAGKDAIDKYFVYKEKLNAIRDGNLLQVIIDDKDEAAIGTERNVTMINHYLKAYDPTYVPRTV